MFRSLQPRLALFSFSCCPLSLSLCILLLSFTFSSLYFSSSRPLLSSLHLFYWILCTLCAAPISISESFCWKQLVHVAHGVQPQQSHSASILHRTVRTPWCHQSMQMVPLVSACYTLGREYTCFAVLRWKALTDCCCNISFSTLLKYLTSSG